MEILGQPWWVQLIGVSISGTGLYFWAAGWYRLLQERYLPIIKAIHEQREFMK